MEDASGYVLRRLAGLVDPGLRTASLADDFVGQSAEQTLNLLAALLAGAEARSAPHRSALLHACQALHSPPLAKLRSAVAQLAADSGQYAITRMFRVIDDAKTYQAATRDLEPLGTRKSQARTAGPAKIAKMLGDPDCRVIAILLTNPRLRLPDVIRIATQRPGNPANQRAVFSHMRWLHHYSVQAALAKNPATPCSLAHCLLYQMRSTDLREISQSGRLDEALRASANRILAHVPPPRGHAH